MGPRARPVVSPFDVVCRAIGAASRSLTSLRHVSSLVPSHLLPEADFFLIAAPVLRCLPVFGTLSFHHIYFPDTLISFCRISVMWRKACGRCGGIPRRHKRPSSDSIPWHRLLGHTMLCSNLSLSLLCRSLSPPLSLTSPCFSFVSTIAVFGCIAERMKEPGWYFVCACDERALKDR